MPEDFQEPGGGAGFGICSGDTMPISFRASATVLRQPRPVLECDDKQHPSPTPIQQMSHIVADDILDVLLEIRRRFTLNGPATDTVELRRDVVRHIAQRELDAKRFKSFVSARDSLEDGCSRRWGGFEIALFEAARRRMAARSA